MVAIVVAPSPIILAMSSFLSMYSILADTFQDKNFQLLQTNVYLRLLFSLFISRYNKGWCSYAKISLYDPSTYLKNT